MTAQSEQFESVYINAALNQFYRQRTRVFIKDFAKVNLTPLQAGIIWRLNEGDGLIQKDIAQSLNISPSAMVGIVNALVDSGFIERRYSPSDRRIVRLLLTEDGREMANKVHEIVQANESKYLQDLTPDEQEQLRLLLIKGYRSWERHEDL